MAQVIDEKGTTSSEVVGQLILELQTNSKTGNSSRSHQGTTEDALRVESNTVKPTGAILSVYDPEINAILGGLL